LICQTVQVNDCNHDESCCACALTSALRGARTCITERSHGARVKHVTAAALSALALVLPASAGAAPGLLLGVDDDSLKWYSKTSSLLSIYNALHLDAVRVTLDWSQGLTVPQGTQRTELQRVANASRRIRIVLAVGGPANQAPQDDAARSSYCGYIANVLRRYPAIRDVAIWTEPNSHTFWQPHKGAAAQYEALLATCWDALHEVNPQANVIATSAPHSDPARWYRDIGKAYRSSLRAQRIFDTVGHNAYPEHSDESPSATHKKRSLDQGDLPQLVKTLRTSFAKSAQPAPGSGGVTVWYLEDGFQTMPYGTLYDGIENDRHPVSEARQAEQLHAAIELAYCQPYVGAFFNFELRDEPSLAGWQSGLLRPDWSAKPSFAVFAETVARIEGNAVTCS
jgi:hypothetical protein